MGKLLIAFALIPAVSQAALVIVESAQQRPMPPASTANVAAPPASGPTAAKATPLPASIAIKTSVLPRAAQPAPSSSANLSIAPLWEAKPVDGTLQRLFARWAKQVGWTTLWDADQDIPLVATAQFTGSFTDAVQEVLRTTESTDTPLHPCFYTNQVMRVVPISTVCDPAKD